MKKILKSTSLIVLSISIFIFIVVNKIIEYKILDKILNYIT